MSITIYNGTNLLLDVGLKDSLGRTIISVISNKQRKSTVHWEVEVPRIASITIEAIGNKYNPYKEDAIKYRTMTFWQKLKFLFGG